MFVFRTSKVILRLFKHYFCNKMRFYKSKIALFFKYFSSKGRNDYSFFAILSDMPPTENNFCTLGLPWKHHLLNCASRSSSSVYQKPRVVDRQDIFFQFTGTLNKTKYKAKSAPCTRNPVVDRQDISLKITGTQQ